MASGPVCAHTPKYGLPRRAAYLEGLKTHHQGLTVPHTSQVFEKDGDALTVSDSSLFAKILVTPVIL